MLHELARITMQKRGNYYFNNTVQKDKMSLAEIAISWSVYMMMLLEIEV
jgi:hypothetical protein